MPYSYIDARGLLPLADAASMGEAIYDLKVLQASARDYGARGDGVADDTAALQLAINSAPAGVVVVDPGTYRVTSTLVGRSNTHIMLMPGAVIDATGIPNSRTVLSFAGSEAPIGSALTISASKYAQTLNVAAGAETAFAVGDYVKVGSTAKWTPNVVANSSMDQRIGEINVVESVASGQVTLRWPLADGYLTGDAAFVAKLTMVENVSVEGPGKIIGKGTGTSSTGIAFDRVVDGKIDGVRLQDFDVRHITLLDAVNVDVDGITVRGGTSTASTFYGVSFNHACQDCRVVNSSFRDCRHAVTTGGSTARSGINRRLVVANNHAVDTTAASFESHAGCEDITFANCTTFNSVGAGVQVRCPKATIVGNTIVRPGDHGIYLRNQSDRATSYRVVGNTVRDGKSRGINYRTPSETQLAGTTAGQAVAGVTISGNTLENCNGEGIAVQSDAAFQLPNVSISGNVVTYASALYRGIRLINVLGAVCTGNVVNTASVGITFDDLCTSCLALGNSLLGCTTSVSRGGGAGHIISTADNGGLYNNTGVSGSPVGPFLAGFEQGTLAATLATTDPGDPDKWNTVSIGANAALVYDGTHAHSGDQAMEVTVGASSVTAFAQWTFGAVTEHFGRAYLWLDAFPGSSLNPIRFQDGANLSCELNVQTNGTVRIIDASGAGIGTTVATVATGQWVRLEWHVIHSATVGLVEVKLFNSPDSAVPTETLTTAANKNTGVQATNAKFGSTTALTSVGPFWMDDIAAIVAGYPGPA